MFCLHYIVSNIIASVQVNACIIIYIANSDILWRCRNRKGKTKLLFIKEMMFESR